MDPVEALSRLGGVAPSAALVSLCGRSRLRAALARGAVVRVARGRYALPDTDRAIARAAEVSGVLALRSAALYHGWAVKWPAELPEIAIARNRHTPRVRGVRLVWVADHDPRRLATAPLDTVVMCARRLPFDQALTIADSALRSGMVTRGALDRACDEARGAGAGRVRRVGEHASALAANPFESVLRAITIELGLRFVPQHPIRAGDRMLHPDLADPVRRIALEADSWEWHTGKQAHVNDCWRYNALVVEGWQVLRFAWEQVMLQPDYVAGVLAGVPARTGRQAEPGFSRRRSA